MTTVINLSNTNYRPRTDAEMELSQVAGILYDQMVLDPDFTLTNARRINDDTGWTYDAHLPSQRPYIGDSWTRVQGAHLSDEALRDAWAIAEAWIAQG